VLVALTDVVVVDISGVVVDGGLCLCLNSQEKGEGRRLKKKTGHESNKWSGKTIAPDTECDWCFGREETSRPTPILYIVIG
jgi:hypothetical protein